MDENVKSDWDPISSAPKDGTPFIGRARNGAGHWMYPWLYRHEGKLYSRFQEYSRETWVDSTNPPEFWLPSSITEPPAYPTES